MDLLNKWYSDRKRQWELYCNNINNSLLSDAIVYITTQLTNWLQTSNDKANLVKYVGALRKIFKDMLAF